MDWQGEQRQRAIEIILHWQGRLNTADLIAAFGISRIQASKDITTYRNAYPDNMSYSLTERTYLRAPGFKLHQIKGTVDEYLDHIARMKTGGATDAIVRLRPHCSVLQREVIARVFNAIISTKQAGIRIHYASMTHPEGQERIIYPHSIIDSGFRWHVRAYCETRQAFRDFNLGRILAPPEATGPAPECAAIANDEQWNEIIAFALIPNPALSEAQCHLLEREFSMTNGRLELEARAALLHYTLQRYQIDPERLDDPPPTQLLAVTDIEQVRNHLFSQVER